MVMGCPGMRNALIYLSPTTFGTSNDSIGAGRPADVVKLLKFISYRNGDDHYRACLPTAMVANMSVTWLSYPDRCLSHFTPNMGRDSSRETCAASCRRA